MAAARSGTARLALAAPAARPGPIDREALERAAAELLRALGADVEDEGLRDTPRREAADDRLPYFFSDQYDVGMEYAGFARTWDRVVLRGDPATREFIAFWLAGDRVVADMNVDVWDVTDAIQRLIRARVPVDDRRLADPGVPLEQLAPVDAGSVA